MNAFMTKTMVFEQRNAKLYMVFDLEGEALEQAMFSRSNDDFSNRNFYLQDAVNKTGKRY